MNNLKLIFASASAAILSIAFSVTITIWAEFSAPLKDWLKNFSGHHWTSKSIFSLLLYVATALAIYCLPQTPDDVRLKKTLGWLLALAALGAIIITLFFAGHHFHLF